LFTTIGLSFSSGIAESVFKVLLKCSFVVPVKDHLIAYS